MNYRNFVGRTGVFFLLLVALLPMQRSFAAELETGVVTDVPTYHQEAYIKAPVNSAGLEFGADVAIDGDTVVVGATLSSVAYVYVREGRDWQLQAALTELTGKAGGVFGISVAISGDTIVVGEENEAPGGKAYVFVRQGSVWSPQATLQPSVEHSGDLFGRSVAISGNTIIVGAIEEDNSASGVNGNPTQGYIDGAGAAYIFVRNGTQWQQQAYLKATPVQSKEYFGSSVTISGDTAVIGTSSFVGSVTGADVVSVFVRNGDIWSQQQRIGTVNGGKVAIVGNSLLVGRNNPNLYIRDGSTWNLKNSFSPPNYSLPDYWQNFFDFSGNRIVLGAVEKGYREGAAYVYSSNGTTWSLEAELRASNPDFGTLFGENVAIDGDTVVVGSTQEKSDSTGINGHQSGYGAPGSGAVYIFSTRPVPSPTCAGLVQEAEQGLLTTPFIIGNDAAASGGQYITSPEGSGDYPLQPIRVYKAEYCFNVPADGIYRLKTNAYAADGNDSFYVLVDDKPAKGFLWDVLPNTTYAVDYVSDRGNFDPALVPLTAGQHLISFHVREDGTRLDRIELEKVAEPPAPPTCDGLVREAESAVLAGAFQIGYDLRASGAMYVYAPEGTGNFYEQGIYPFHKAEYCFNVPTSGTYRILTKAYGTFENNVFYVQVDGAPAEGYLWDISPNTTYEYGYVNDRGKADPIELELSAGQHTVTFYVGNDGARLDTIELENVADAPNRCGGLFQEAEDGVRSGNFIVATDAAASNGQYIHTPEGSGSFWNGPFFEHKSVYCFNVETPGIYRVKGKVYGADTLSDSFYVQIDDAPPTGLLWDVLPNTTYAEDSLSDRGVADPVEVLLSSGQHTVTIFAREDGTRLDTIELQWIDAGVDPTPTCGELLQEAEEGVLVGNFVTEVDEKASGGKYIHTPNGSGDFWDGPNPKQKAIYCFNVAYGGGFELQGNVLGADTLSDSFYVQIDGEPAKGYLWDVRSGASYTLDSLNDRNNKDPVSLSLPAGQHTVTIYAREDGTRLDTLWLMPTVPSEGRTAVSQLAQGVHGTIHLNATNLTQEIDFSQITVTLVDAETGGQSFRQQVVANRFGQFHFDGMTPGQYKVRLTLPSGLTATTSEVTITATADEPIDVIFDVSTQSEAIEDNSKTYLPLINR